nr:uncharacterized protein LOC127303937 [Lolium perenne]
MTKHHLGDAFKKEAAPETVAIAGLGRPATEDKALARNLSRHPASCSWPDPPSSLNPHLHTCPGHGQHHRLPSASCRRGPTAPPNARTTTAPRTQCCRRAHPPPRSPPRLPSRPGSGPDGPLRPPPPSAVARPRTATTRHPQPAVPVASTPPRPPTVAAPE